RRPGKRLFPLGLRAIQLGSPFVPGALARPESFFQMPQSVLLIARWRLDHRRGVAVLDRLAALRHVIEEREQLIVLFLSEWIVLVTVTAGAAQGHAQPSGRGGVEPVHERRAPVLPPGGSHPPLGSR